MRQCCNIKHDCYALPLVLFALISSPVYATTSPNSSESWVVNFLPGFSHNLPFKFHTGYIGVGKGEEVQLFYYLVESEHDPDSDPLMLWLTGGPGCSGLCSFFDEYLGPLSFNYTGLSFNYKTSTWEIGLPPLKLNPYAWTKFASILFLDSPVGAGYSYATTSESYYADDTVTTQHIYEFMQKWFMVHPQFTTNPFYVGGSSYSGMIVPFVTQKIIQGNEDDNGSQINIKGYVLGSPMTDIDAVENARFDFTHRASLISDELYKSSKADCSWNASSADCDKSMKYAAYLMESLYDEHILYANAKSLNPSKWCPEYNRRIVDNWVNNAHVREALHVRKGTVGDLNRCNVSLKSFQSYNQTMLSSVDHHQYLTNKPIRALIYSGDQELTVPYVDTIRWIKKINAQIYDYWRPWFLNDQIAGYVTEYSNGHYNLTFTTIKGAGHCPSAYNPLESFAMFGRWLGSSPL